MAFHPKTSPQPRKPAPGTRGALPASGPKANAPRVAPWTPAQWQAALPEALAAMGVVASEAQQAQLVQYMVLLAHWNATFNLTALRDPREMLSLHLMDCLAVLSPLARHVRVAAAGRGQGGGGGLGSGEGAGEPKSQAVRLLDVGSGGGLPGVVLAICCPEVQVTCVDTVGKKAAFIRQVAAELRLGNLRAEHARVEALRGHFDVVTSRAFASLPDFVALTRGLLSPQGVWMAMKGKVPDDEVAGLPSGVAVFHVEPLHVPGLDAQRCLVWMRPVASDAARVAGVVGIVGAEGVRAASGDQEGQR